MEARQQVTEDLIATGVITFTGKVEQTFFTSGDNGLPEFDLSDELLKKLREAYNVLVAVKKAPEISSTSGLIQSKTQFRIDWTDGFCFVPPNILVLKAIADFAQGSPVLSLGAGKGFWSHLLVELFGVKVVATDKSPQKNLFMDVLSMDGRAAVANLASQETVLMLIWPYMEGWVSEAVTAAIDKGVTKVVYVGEDQRGCTGHLPAVMYEDAEWVCTSIELPSFPGIHPQLFLYESISSWSLFS